MMSSFWVKESEKIEEVHMQSGQGVQTDRTKAMHMHSFNNLKALIEEERTCRSKPSTGIFNYGHKS